MIKLVPANTPTQRENIKALYHDAFPLVERKPFSLILDKCREGTMRMAAIEDDKGAFCGLVILILYRDLVLLDYFAVCPALRGRKIGSQVLTLLQRQYSDRKFILEIESTVGAGAADHTKVRRKAFYLAGGMTPMPYLVELFGVEMEVLAYQCSVSFAEYHELFVQVFSSAISSKIKLARYL